MFDDLWRDLKYGIQAPRKSPGFTVTALLVLAFGIGANTAVFSVISAVLLRPLPGIADPGRMVSIYRTQSSQTFDNLGYPDYRDFRDRNRTLRGLAAHAPVAISINHGSPERLIGDLVTPNYFPILGVRPAAGRLLSAEQEGSVVISHALWQRQFGGSADAIGAKVDLNEHPFTIVGVTEEGFHGTDLSLAIDMWASLRPNVRNFSRFSNDILENRSAGWLQLFGRLKSGADWRQADAEVRTISQQLAQAYPASNSKRMANVSPGVGIYPDDRAAVTGLFALLSGAVALLLLIACANVAGLMTVRASGRVREIAIRLAIGAGRARIVRQLLTEGMLLAMLAGILGVLLATWATQAVIAATQGTAPSLVRHAGVRIDAGVLGFTLLASVITGLLFALLPAAQSMKVDLTSALKSGLPGAGRRRTWLRAALVAGQVALSLVLLSGASLLLRGLYRIVTANPGFDANNVAMASVDLNLEGYSDERGQIFYRGVLDRLRTMPGIDSASIASSVPPNEWPGAASIFYPGQEPTQGELQGHEFELGTRVNIDRIAPGYFQTLRIPLLAGRDFTDRDRAGAPGVVIVSRKLAEKMWPGENPIGKQIAYPRWAGPARPPFEVVGVAGDVKHLALTRDAPLLMYIPAAQEYDGRARLVVRTRTDGRDGIAAIQHAVAGIDKNIAVYSPQTGSQHSADSLWQQQMAAGWIGSFSIGALLLAAVGLYAVIAQSVAQRTREVGIRVALGAKRSSVAALIVVQGLRLAAGGIALGVPAAIAFDGFVQQRLAGMGAPGALSLAAIAILLVVVTIGACWIPARRAARVDPIQALRCE
jgi:putative ABC transport system permease protein